MRFLHQMGSHKLAYSFGGVLLTGSFFSSILTEDVRWIQWHFSRLGEGETFSSYIFNITLIISSVLMYYLAVNVRDSIKNISTEKLNINISNRASSTYYKAFCYVTVCLLGVAIFPFDRFPIVHNIFGYSMLFTFLYLCIFSQRILPIFSKQFYIFGYFIIFLTMILYTFFLGFKTITLLFVEAVILIFLYRWFILFLNGINDMSKNT